jgi:hypothetical protein
MRRTRSLPIRTPSQGRRLTASRPPLPATDCASIPSTTPPCPDGLRTIVRASRVRQNPDPLRLNAAKGRTHQDLDQISLGKTQSRLQMCSFQII